MWRPPQRIRHRPDPGHWPTADEAAGSLLFRPLEHGPLRLEARTWVPAMVPWRASEEGFVTPALLAWYERLARGRPGALVVEATGIRDVPSGPLLRVGDDRFVPGLRDLVARAREASGGRTRLLVQLIDFLAVRRRPTPERFFGRHLRITDRHREHFGLEARDDGEIRRRLLALSPEEQARALTPRELEALRYGLRERVTDVDLPHVRDLPRELPGLFANAARRAREAGFDGVELHFAHAYTMASFLSATNDRADGYGGTREHRVRLALEVVAAVREAVGNDYPVGCRYLADECIDGGNGVPDATWLGIELARARLDFLSLSRGGKFDDAKQPAVGWSVYPYTGPSGYECMPSYISDERGPFGRNLAATREIRAALRAVGLSTPVVLAGGVHGFGQAESALREGHADLVAAARQSLADPDWFEKVRLGRGHEVRTCEYTNYCEGLDQKHKQVTCKLWDRLDLDGAGDMRSRDGRRRLVAPPWTR